MNGRPRDVLQFIDTAMSVFDEKPVSRRDYSAMMRVLRRRIMLNTTASMQAIGRMSRAAKLKDLAQSGRL